LFLRVIGLIELIELIQLLNQLNQPINDMLTEHNIQTPNGRIYGKSSGDQAKPLIIGIHGWSRRNGWHTWEPLLEPLGSAGFFALSVDMPGWGESDPWGSGALSNDQGVEAALAIMSAFDKESAVLMGKSWGGAVAIQAALSHPNQITRLILTAPAYSDYSALKGLRQPVLLAWAEDDPVIPFQYAANFVEAAPNVRLEAYPTGGHSAAAKNAAEFAPKAVEFLKSN
jgi:pimeloyl-ACP methyl ester carboxylesterase